MNTDINLIPKSILRGCDIIVRTCANIKEDESLIIISDYTTQKIGEHLKAVALNITKNVVHRIIQPLTTHGQEPPQEISRQMISFDAIIGLTKMSMAHTQARLKASLNGAKYVSLPDYSIDVLTNEALLIDFKSMTKPSFYIAKLLTEGDEITIRSKVGTHLVCNIKNRIANAAPGWCLSKGSIASPPDVETNIALIEDGSNGILVVDGSITCEEIGILHSPFTLTIENGIVVKVQGGNASLLRSVYSNSGNPATRIVAEFGIGLNPKAELCGKMLLDEGSLGTVHIGIGSNATIGGVNNVPFHLDHVIRHPTVYINSEIMMENGRMVKEFAGLTRQIS